MTTRRATRLITAGFTIVAFISAGCGQHVEKKHEELVSPSQKGTPAEREPEGPIHHGQAPSNVEP